MSIKKKVAVVFTGGTISMTIDPELGAAIPSLSGEEILSLATNINKVATIEGHNFDEIPSPHMTFEKLVLSLDMTVLATYLQQFVRLYQILQLVRVFLLL